MSPPPQRKSSTDARRPPPAEARPSSSVVLISPLNQVLLLHRVHTSSSFASAHVFPGGNLDEFHEGPLPSATSPERHRDGPAYRLGAIRETFEETGILLAKRDGVLVHLPVEERDVARKKIHGNEIKFKDWLDSLNATPDLDGLVPFTRWITPPANKKRFTTQMYLYLLPLSTGHLPAEMHIPTPDNGIEHTAALFAPAALFLARARARANAIILFPPQAFLLSLIAGLFTGKPKSSSTMDGPIHLASQRRKLLAFIRRVPTAETARGKDHPTAQIAWGEKVIGPHTLFVRSSDGRSVLGLDKPGLELKDSDRGGDWERVVLVNFEKAGPKDVEVRKREDVVKEEKMHKFKDEMHKL